MPNRAINRSYRSSSGQNDGVIGTVDLGIAPKTVPITQLCRITGMLDASKGKTVPWFSPLRQTGSLLNAEPSSAVCIRFPSAENPYSTMPFSTLSVGEAHSAYH